MINRATYLYGFVRQGTELCPDLSGIEPDADVRVIPVARRAAVVSEVPLVGIELLSVEARVVIASVETYPKYAEAIGLTATAATPA